MPTLQQNRTIHALRRACAMTEADYRGLLRDRFRVASSTELGDDAAETLIEALRGLAPSAPRPALRLDGRYAPVLRALWMSAYALNIVDNRDDRALIAFCTRQTGLESTRFLITPDAARPVIEALKAMCARAGVTWSARRDPLGDKREICRAVFELARAKGAWRDNGGESFPQCLRGLALRIGLGGAHGTWTAHDYDVLAQALGTKLRTHPRAAKETPA